MSVLKTDIRRVQPPVGDQNPLHKNTNRLKVIRGVIIALVVVLGILALGAAYIWFSGGSGLPSGNTTAPVLALEPGDPRLLFHIIPNESEVRFIVDETLLGRPKTVIGSTDEAAGSLLVDLQNPANSRLGVIRVNVRTLTTDNEFRTRALRGQILHADRPEYEFAEFSPTTLTGMPESVSMSEPFEFQVKGTLTVHGVAREVIFQAKVTLISQSRLEGSAQTVVHYADFGMTIPEAPGVANVSDEVKLEIDFVAMVSEE